MKLPEGVKASVEGRRLTISGPKGTVSKVFNHPDARISIQNGEVEIGGGKKIEATIEAHIRNMAIGVTEGYTKKLKAVYSHFPISVEVKGKELLIKNFLGEKQPRRARIAGETKVEAKGQELTVSGPSKEDVGQTIANIRSATKIRNRDSRVFQDGFYIVEQ
ncbi:MAG: 50S ribosomal protein L6 [Candidatus Micrarchaeota archaeon]|nr:50S ribosomal protein L6 [Candidatus Micrarchaeota archaeon]